MLNFSKKYFIFGAAKENKMTTSKIHQAVAKVAFFDGNHKWFRVSRQKHDSLIRNFRNMPNFRYVKFYEIVNYNKHTTKRGGTHQIGRQIGFITLNGHRFF